MGPSPPRSAWLPRGGKWGRGGDSGPLAPRPRGERVRARGPILALPPCGIAFAESQRLAMF